IRCPSCSKGLQSQVSCLASLVGGVPPFLPPLFNILIDAPLYQERDASIVWVEQAVEFDSHLVNLAIHAVVEVSVPCSEVPESRDQRALDKFDEPTGKRGANAQHCDALADPALSCLVREPVESSPCR